MAGEAHLAQFDRGGLEPLSADLPSFAARLRSESHTLKRSLTDPRLFSGIGNAYSDEILHRARLSPLALTGRITDAEVGLTTACGWPAAEDLDWWSGQAVVAASRRLH